MKKIIVFIITLLTLNGTFAQDCKCPKNDLGANKIDTIYKFSNENSIALCGYRNEDETFSEFLLADCKNNKVLDYWGAVQTCKIYQKENKLIVEELVALPINSNNYEDVTWRFVEFYSENNIFKSKNTINKNLPKYSQKQIDGIIKQYETSDNKLNDNCIVLANKLFISAISGSQKAKQCFLEFPTKFKGLDGALSEEYHDLESMLSAWEREK